MNTKLSPDEPDESKQATQELNDKHARTIIFKHSAIRDQTPQKAQAHKNIQTTAKRRTAEQKQKQKITTH